MGSIKGTIDTIRISLMSNAPELIKRSNRKIGNSIFVGVWKMVRFLSTARSEYQWRAERHRSRMQLLRMDDHILRDIGITRGDAIEEAKRDFWD